MRSSVAILFGCSLLAGCAPGGYPANPDAAPPPFDAFQAGMRLAVGMPRDVAILRVGWTPISSKVTNCGTLAGDASPCEVLKFGTYENNQLFVYLVPTDSGNAVVTSWTVYKS